MVLSQRCEYAVRTAPYLAAADRSGYVAVRVMSAALGIPHPFLAKIVQDLTSAGVFASMRGPDAGFALARPAAQIRLKAIVLSVDGAALFSAYVLGLPGCGDRQPCPLHDQ